MQRQTPLEIVMSAAESAVFDTRDKYLVEVDILSDSFYDAFSSSISENKIEFIKTMNSYYSRKFFATTGFVKYTVDDNIPILIGTIIENPGDEFSYVNTFQATSFKTSSSFEVILRSSLFSLYDSIQAFVKNAKYSISAKDIEYEVPRFQNNLILNRVRNNLGIDTPLNELNGISNGFINYLLLSKRVRSLVGPAYRWEDDLLLHNYHFNAIIRV